MVKAEDRTARPHLAPVESEPPGPDRGWQRYTRRLTATEISSMSRYYDAVLQWRPLPHDSGELLDLIDCEEKRLIRSPETLPDLSGETDRRSIVLLNGALNHSFDAEAILRELRAKLSRSSRVVLVAYNPYHKPLYTIANRLGLRGGEEPSSFVTQTDLHNLAKLSGFEVVRSRPAAFFPMQMAGIGNTINRLAPIAPGMESLSSAWIIVLRPIVKTERLPSLSIVIPARNERGNIEAAVTRLRYLEHVDLEIIFVEGHSSDGTWEEIERVRRAYASEFRIRSFRQPGKGKNDAVRVGFEHAEKELLTILDADLTMPPELLGRFYDAYCEGLGDFVNGNRLTYPMEGDAMRSLNRLGNIFFAKALSAVLDARLGDSLCGTKLLSATDYRRILKWRGDFGDFDPFGDFELLFPAAVLGLGIVDIPIRYRARTYGSTQISRFRHGAQLLRMTAIGLAKIKAGRV